MLASICKSRGLGQRAERYSKAGRLTYYGESDRLGREAVHSDSPAAISEIKAILTDLSAVDDMKDSSMSIVAYNLARISAKEGNLEEAKELLRRARSFDAEEVDGRYELDPLFKDVKAAGGPLS